MKTEKNITIGKQLTDCFSVAADIASYPDWLDGIQTAKVLETDGDDRPLQVEFVAQSFGRSTTYVLVYDYSSAPEVLSWSLVTSDILNSMSGSYSFAKSADDSTEALYTLDLDLAVSLPGFVQRRAEDKIVSSALEGLKSRVEGL